MIFFGKPMLDRAVKIFLEHYHNDRPHPGLDNELIVPFERPPPSEGKIEVDKRLGGPFLQFPITTRIIDLKFGRDSRTTWQDRILNPDSNVSFEFFDRTI